jgi:hypothetical protein
VTLTVQVIICTLWKLSVTEYHPFYTHTHTHTHTYIHTYRLDDRGSRIRFPVEAGSFSLHCVQNGSGPTQPPGQWVPGFFSLGVKRPGRDANHSPPPSAEVKNSWSYTSTPPVRLHGVVLTTLPLQNKNVRISQHGAVLQPGHKRVYSHASLK